MVAPVTGPYTVTKSSLGGANAAGFRPTVYESVSTGYRQKPPFTLPLTYSRTVIKCLSFSSSDPLEYNSTAWSIPIDDDLKTKALNQAYEKLYESVGDSAQLGSTLGERKQAMAMVATRVRHLSRVLRHLPHNPSRAYRELTVGFTGDRPTLKKGIKTVADFWLETWFGWKPLISDIGDAIEVLQSPYPMLSIRGVGMAFKNAVNAPVTTLGPYGGFSTIQTGAYHRYNAWLGAKVRMQNPNLYLANQLGLVNPASVIWELTPWSFVVDWFGNVSNFIRSWSDFTGLEITDAWTSQKQNLVEVFNSNAMNRTPLSVGDPPHIEWKVETAWKNLSKQKVVFSRSPGIAGPKLRFQLPDRISATRAMTAVSLLTQQLLKGVK